MFCNWVSKIAEVFDPSAPTSLSSPDLERVSAVLLVEIARADHAIDDRECAAIKNALAKASSLTSEELDALIKSAFDDANNASSLHEHVSAINEHFSKANKIALIEQMWRVGLADGDIDGYEDYTIRKLCDLLFIRHRDFMQAKHRVLNEA